MPDLSKSHCPQYSQASILLFSTSNSLLSLHLCFFPFRSNNSKRRLREIVRQTLKFPLRANPSPRPFLPSSPFILFFFFVLVHSSP